MLISAQRATRTLLVALTAVVCGALLPATAAAAIAPFAFSAPVAIDTQAPYGNADTATGVSCPTTSLCVVVSRDYSHPGDSQDENVEISRDPTDATPKWSSESGSIADLDGVSCTSSSPGACVLVGSDGYVSFTADQDAGPPQQVDAGHQLTAVSCDALAMCVAVDDSGRAVSTAAVTADRVPWSVPADIDAARTLTAISCPSSSLCTAVDGSGHAVFSTNPASNTPTWSTPATIDPGHAIFAVSCPTASLCVAVDDSGRAIVGSGFATTASWSAPTDVDPDAALSGISCPSASLCVAVDEAGDELSATNLTTSPTWTQPSDAHDDVPLAAVSCPSAALCVAVDYFSDALNSTDPADSAPAWGFVATQASSNALLSVSCPAAGSCVAVDDAGRVFASTDTTAPTPSWTSVQADDWEAMTSISCPSTTFCVAVDDFGEALISTDPLAANPSWSPPEHVDGGEWIAAVSCPTTSLCVAVDEAGNELIATSGAGTVSWSAPVDIDGTHTLTGLSCPSTSLCEAVDDAGQTLATSSPPTPGAWTTTSFPGAAGGALVGVSCASSTLCVVAGANGTIGVSDAAAAGGWNTLQGVSGVDGLACSPATPTTVCLGLGDSGISVWLAEGAASTVAAFDEPDLDNGLTGASCPTLSACELVDAYGEVSTASADVVSVSVAASGGGSGTVTDAAGVLNCPGICGATYSPGNAVTLTANPAPGSTFVGWTGACSGEGQCELNTGGASVATFVKTPVVSVTIAGQGSVALPALQCTGLHCLTRVGPTCPGTCSEPIPPGLQISLTATPAAGWVFAGWSGGGCVSAATCTTTISADQHLTATFVPAAISPASLRIAYAGRGHGSVSNSAAKGCSSTCTLSLHLGQALTLTATAKAGSHFAGWSGACTTAAASCKLLLATATRVTATFSLLAPNTRISSLRVLSTTVRAKLAAIGTHTQIQCALVRERSGARSHPKATIAYKRCGTTTTFHGLRRGRYTLYARAVGPGGHDATPAARSFTISRDAAP